MESVSVLYLIGEVSPVSVPLEVAQFIRDPRIELHVVAFYETEYSGEHLDVPLSQIDATSRYDLSGVHQLYRHFGRICPDVVHVHHTVSAFWGSIFGKVVGARVVRSEHNDYEFYTPGQRAVKTISQGLSDFVLFNSRNTYQSMEEWRKRLVGDRWEVVYNGIDVERIDRATASRLPFEEWEEGVTVGSVGRFVNQKNYCRLIRAFAQVVNQAQESLRLVLIGDGKNREAIEAEVRRLKLGEHVVLTGEVERDAVYSALQSFDLFVVPSLWEGFCNAAVEAMAAGLPLLCSDIQTLHEVVGDVAVYADPHHTAQMASALHDLIRKAPEEWEAQGKRARERATTHFTVQRTAEKYVENYLRGVSSGIQANSGKS